MQMFVIFFYYLKQFNLKSLDLPQGTHTIKVYATGQNNNTVKEFETKEIHVQAGKTQFLIFYFFEINL